MVDRVRRPRAQGSHAREARATRAPGIRRGTSSWDRAANAPGQRCTRRSSPAARAETGYATTSSEPAVGPPPSIALDERDVVVREVRDPAVGDVHDVLDVVAAQQRHPERAAGARP